MSSRKTPFHSMTMRDMECAERRSFARAFDEREERELEDRDYRERRWNTGAAPSPLDDFLNRVTNDVAEGR